MSVAYNITSADVDHAAAFARANEERLVRVAWEVARTVAYASLAFGVVLIALGRPASELSSILAFLGGYLALWGSYQCRWYTAARYALWTGSMLGLPLLVAHFGVDSLSFLLLAPLILASLLLFRPGLPRGFTATASLALGVTLCWWQPAGVALEGATAELLRSVFVLLTAWVSYTMLQGHLRLNRDFRRTSRRLLQRSQEQVATLEAERADADAHARRLDAATVRLAAEVEAGARLGHRLRASNEQLEQFAYAASHDLKEPLRSITGFVQLIRRRVGADLAVRADLSEYFDFVVANAQAMTQLLDDLLAYSRVGRIADAAEPVSLDRLAAGVVYGLQAALQEAGGSCEVAGRLGDVYASKTLLRGVLERLLDNAVRFRAADRPLRIRISAEPIGAGRVRLRVADNGRGVPAEFREQAFGLFARLGTRDEGAGSGVGLAFCRKAAAKMRGTLRLEDTDLGGVAAVLELPTQAPPHDN